MAVRIEPQVLDLFRQPGVQVVLERDLQSPQLASGRSCIGASLLFSSTHLYRVVHTAGTPNETSTSDHPRRGYLPISAPASRERGSRQPLPCDQTHRQRVPSLTQNYIRERNLNGQHSPHHSDPPGIGSGFWEPRTTGKAVRERDRAGHPRRPYAWGLALGTRSGSRLIQPTQQDMVHHGSIRIFPWSLALLVTYSCIDCGNTFTKFALWSTVKCPKCGSKKTYPLIGGIPPAQPPKGPGQPSDVHGPGENFCNSCRTWTQGTFCSQCGRKLL